MRILFLALLLCSVPTFARDLNGEYQKTDPELHKWFDSLASGKGLCCSFADGHMLEPDDIDTKDNHYRVRIDGQWIIVPDDAVVTVPNRFGQAVVWPYDYDGTGTKIRCFLPGAGA